MWIEKAKKEGSRKRKKKHERVWHHHCGEEASTENKKVHIDTVNLRQSSASANVLTVAMPPTGAHDTLFRRVVGVRCTSTVLANLTKVACDFITIVVVGLVRVLGRE